MSLAPPDCTALVLAEQPELKRTRNHCHSCLALVKVIYFLASFTTISCSQPNFSTRPPQNIHLQASYDQNWQRVLCCQQVLLQAWKAKSSLEGTEEVLSRGPSSQGFSFSSQRFPQRLFQSHHYSNIKDRKKVLLCCCLAPSPAPRSCGACGALH